MLFCYVPLHKIWDGIFIEPLIEPIADPIVDPDIFIAQLEEFFESPEQFLAGYQRLSMASSNEERQKNLDLYIGMALIGQRGREQMYERLRLIYEKHKRQQ